MGFLFQLCYFTRIASEQTAGYKTGCEKNGFLKLIQHIPVSKNSKYMTEYLVLQRVHQWEMLLLQSLQGDRDLLQLLALDLFQQALQETRRGFLGRHKKNQTPVNLLNRKTNVYVITRTPFLSLKLVWYIYKTKKCIKELYLIKMYLSLSVCILNTTMPDQAVP